MMSTQPLKFKIHNAPVQISEKDETWGKVRKLEWTIEYIKAPPAMDSLIAEAVVSYFKKSGKWMIDEVSVYINEEVSFSGYKKIADVLSSKHSSVANLCTTLLCMPRCFQLSASFREK